MRKRNIKYTTFLLGVLLAGNATLHAAPKHDTRLDPAAAAPALEASVGSPDNGAPASGEPVSREELEGVRSEIATLQERLDRTYERNTAQTLRPLFITGVAQLRFTQNEKHYNSGTYGNGNKADNQSGLSLNALILNFQGNLKRDFEEGRNINYLFSLVAPSGVNTGSNNFFTNEFTVRPLDAYVSKFILPSLDPERPLLNVIVGQQKKPFGLEAQAAEDKKPTILSAMSARANLSGSGDVSNGANAGAFPSNGLNLDARDIGIVVKGDLFPKYDPGFRYRVAAVEYSIGVLNGSGPNAQDNNGHKDISGRLVLNAPVDYSSIFRGLSVGGSYYTGKSWNGTVDVDRKRWGADISYVNTPIGFTYEYVHGQDANVKKAGSTLTVFYNYGEQFVNGYKYQDRYDDWYPTTFQPFVRFDWWDPDTSLAGNRIEITTIGVNWFLAQTTKLQLNYNIVNAETYTGPKNQFLAQVQYSF